MAAPSLQSDVDRIQAMKLKIEAVLKVPPHSAGFQVRSVGAAVSRDALRHHQEEEWMEHQNNNADELNQEVYVALGAMWKLAKDINATLVSLRFPVLLDLQNLNTLYDTLQAYLVDQVALGEKQVAQARTALLNAEQDAQKNNPAYSAWALRNPKKSHSDWVKVESDTFHHLQRTLAATQQRHRDIEEHGHAGNFDLVLFAMASQHRFIPKQWGIKRNLSHMEYQLGQVVAECEARLLAHSAHLAREAAMEDIKRSDQQNIALEQLKKDLQSQLQRQSSNHQYVLLALGLVGGLVMAYVASRLGVKVDSPGP